MKSISNSIIIIISILCLPVFLNAQGIGFLPLQDNPSFAGAAKHSRLISNLRYSQERSTNNSQSFGAYFSYDKFIKKIGTGIGVTFSQSFYNYESHLDQSSFKYNGKHTNGSLSVAPKFSLKGKYTISPSMQFSFTYSESYNNSNPPPTNNNFDPASSNWYGKMGLSFNARKYYIALSNKLFKKSQQERFFQPNLQAGYVFEKEDSKFSFIPQLAILYHGSYERYFLESFGLQYNLGFKYGKFLWGIYGDGDDFIPPNLNAGIQSKNWKIVLLNNLQKNQSETINYSPRILVRYLFHQDDPLKNLIYY